MSRKADQTKDIKKTKPTILYLGENGFPHRFAAINRQRYIARGLSLHGYNLWVICRRGVLSAKDHYAKDLKNKGMYQGINYIYSSGSVIRSDSFLKRNINKAKGFFMEFIYIFSLVRHNNVKFLFISSFSFYQVLYYRILALCLGCKIVLDVVEKNSAIPERKKLKYMINDFLYENYLFKMMNGVIYINDLLGDYISSKAGNTILLKIPVIFDYDRIKKNELKTESSKYFLFCGHVFYINTVRFILESFNLLNDVEFNLKLVLYGNKVYMNKIISEIKSHSKSHRIKIYSDIPDDELFNLYRKARALLIPLFDTMQDKTRFPQKISEYLATGNPVISTDVGEVKNYLKHDQTALLAKEVNTEIFAQLMQITIDDVNKTKEIGLNGRLLGERTFDYRVLGKRISSFLKVI